MLKRTWFKVLAVVLAVIGLGLVTKRDANAEWTAVGEWGTCACEPGPNPPQLIAFCLFGFGEECTRDDQCDTDHCS
jgi:hypothetical protein